MRAVRLGLCLAVLGVHLAVVVSVARQPLPVNTEPGARVSHSSWLSGTGSRTQDRVVTSSPWMRKSLEMRVPWT